MKYTDLRTHILNNDDPAKAIEILRGDRQPVDTACFKGQWDPEQHDVALSTKRPDKQIKYEDDDGKTQQKIEKVNRVPVPLQKAIVGKAVTFLFGNPVHLKSQTDAEADKQVLSAVTRILDDNKTDSQNRVIAKNLFRSTQVAEIWYPEEKAEVHHDYGFPTKFRLRLSVFTPWNGDELFPYFDEVGDLIAFSRAYSATNDEGKITRYFETYTADLWKQWRQDGSGWVALPETKNVLGKIPVVFAEQDNVEWHDVQRAICRLETLLSNHGDTNDYNGSPMIVSEGKIVSIGSKGERGRIVEVEKGGKLEYLSWDHAPESIKLEIENLFKIIHSYTQTPDISFESVKGIGPISGIALRFLFMDAHLKVMDKREVFDPYLKRRLNILKGFVGILNTNLKTPASQLQIDAEIVPYTIEDLVEKMTALTTANGGKPLLSQRSSVTLADMVADKAGEWEEIQKEAEAANTADIFQSSK